MLQQEFQALTGMKVSDSAYKQIEEMYMNTDLEKHDFCKDFKKHSESVILMGLFDRVQKMTKELALMKKERQDLVDYLILQSGKNGLIELRKKAIEMVGKKQYLLRKLEMGLNTWSGDKEILMEILSQ